jgi:hypothetical protein
VPGHLSLRLCCCGSFGEFVADQLTKTFFREVSGLRSTKLSTSADFESRRSILAKGLLFVGAATSVPLKTKAEALEDYKIYQILQECKKIPGSFRYVAVTAGGVVLETAGVSPQEHNFTGMYF